MTLVSPTANDAFDCRLGNVPGEFEGFNAKDNEPDDYPFALAAIVTTSGEALTLQCRAEADVDQVEVRNGTLVAPKVG